MGNHVDNLEIIDQFMVVAKVKLLHKRKKEKKHQRATASLTGCFRS